MWVAVLAVVCGLIVWHTIHWYTAGIHLEMFTWVGTDKAYMTVLYNLGLMLVLGAVLSFLMEKVADLIGYAAEK